jgi:hypothetical protein
MTYENISEMLRTVMKGYKVRPVDRIKYYLKNGEEVKSNETSLLLKSGNNGIWYCLFF